MTPDRFASDDLGFNVCRVVIEQSSDPVVGQSAVVTRELQGARFYIERGYLFQYFVLLIPDFIQSNLASKHDI
jgi:hypothetical protein